MENSKFTTIDNVPEKLSGLGYGAHFLGICLFLALIVCEIPLFVVDGTSWIKEIIEVILSSGIFIILGMFFIFIFCPIYFLIRFLMEFFKCQKSRWEFYSNPNIKYIKLYDDEIFFKNTCSNHDFTIKKRDIVEVILEGKVIRVSDINDVAGIYKPKVYITNSTLTIKTKNQQYTIYPNITKIKRQINFYESYFNNFHVLLNSDEVGIIRDINGFLTEDNQEYRTTDKFNFSFNFIYIIVLIVIFLGFLYQFVFKLK